MTLPARTALAALSAISLLYVLIVTPASSRAGRADGPTLTTVSFDFQSEIKTTFYSDGSVYEEGFDADRMRKLATRPAPEGR